MDKFSIIWFLLITVITGGVYMLGRMFLAGRRKRLTFLAVMASTYIYSGVGIAYANVNKINALYYAVFIAVLAIAYCLFVNVRIRSLAGDKIPRLVDDTWLWEGNIAKWVFVGLMVLYIALRLISLVYPVNHLANFRLIYNSENNINNLTGKNTSILTTVAAIIQPFFFVGLYYAFKKVRYVAAFMSLDALITLITAGYLSRHEIVTIAIVCVLLYINGDMSKKPITLSKKSIRFLLIGMILVPVLAVVLVWLMNVRTSGGETYTISRMLETEIGFPKQYLQIHTIGAIVKVKDFFLQLLDSFVPVLPTPGYQMDLNVTFSEIMLGVDIDSSDFYIKLPSILGESFLIFGGTFFWVHAIVIAFLTALVYKVVGENVYLSVLWYYYITCVFKVGRAGYAELSQSVWLNYVVFFTVILVVRLLTGIRRESTWQREPINP